MNTQTLSSCCKAPVETKSNGSAIISIHLVCTSCGKPCTVNASTVEGQPWETEEYKRTVKLAEKLLDEPYADPDDDLRMLARQFNRAVERISLFSDSTLREVTELLPKKMESGRNNPFLKIMYDHAPNNAKFYEENVEKINSFVDKFQAIITKRLEKNI